MKLSGKDERARDDGDDQRTRAALTIDAVRSTELSCQERRVRRGVQGVGRDLEERTNRRIEGWPLPRQKRVEGALNTRVRCRET
jgi:hypothetical protein